ncbi:hypothetical protein PLICRDRAFT_686035 [Plicaturopsis crispa FD-325 SS-3]|nr:hypothetical protein PLICRDRAFT_686035 [Plicaturopsis crispa FD-325 SS-3]
MKTLQTLLPLGHLFDTYHSIINSGGSPDVAVLDFKVPSTQTHLCSVATTNFSAVDFSDSSVRDILEGSSDSTPAKSGEGFAGLSRPVQGDAPRLRVHHHTRHGHARSAALAPAQTCPDPPVLSCSAAASSTDSCCVINPGGVLVHVQLWDLNIGEADSFGIHGLWPDKCNGQYYENCDSSRGYSASTISNQLPSSLRSYMETYWQSNDESPEAFWQHEWKTHGTCVSTLDPSCFEGYQSGAEVVPYFETVVALFKQLDSYKALTDAGITPSSSKSYAASAMQSAISSGTGYTPDLVCSNGALTSIQFYLNARGPLQDGDFEQSAPTRTSTCPSEIKWKPKTV